MPSGRACQRRFSLRDVAGAIAIVAMLAAGFAPAVAAHAAATGTGSTLNLVASGPSRAVVRLPGLHLEPNLRSADAGLAVRVSGPGTLYGIVFRPVGTKPGDDARELAIVKTAIPGREYPAVILGSDADGDGKVGPLPDSLPGGKYIAYIAAQGRVGVSVTFPGTGTARVVHQPRHDAHVQVNTVENGPAGTPTLALATGRTVHAGEAGLAYVSFSWWVMPAAAVTYGFGCTYFGAPLNDALYSVPGTCTTGGQAGVGGVDAGVNYVRLGLDWSHRPPGTYGEKTSIVAVGVPQSLGITQIYITG